MQRACAGSAPTPLTFHERRFSSLARPRARFDDARRGCSGARKIDDPLMRCAILTVAQPFSNHNGGWLGFSPNDGYLYVAMGDGGSFNDPQGNGQNQNTLLGKMLRIDVSGSGTYTIPANNPFFGSVTQRQEIWAYGLRNPWRPAFDRITGDLWIADVGQDVIEEVNFQAAKVNSNSSFCFESSGK